MPTVPGFRAEPLDLMVRLTSLVLPVTKVMLPVVIAEALEPVVASKTRLLAVPLTLAATLIAPVWLMRLFETNERPEPLAKLIVPAVTMPEEPPAAALFAVTERLEPAPVSVMPARLAIVAPLAPVALIAMPVLAESAPV